jgi:glyoxylate reductase
LVSGHLAGAGLDVFEKEPDVHPELLAAPNAVLLPHIGSATEETRHAMASLAAENAAAMLRGKEPPTPVVRGGLGGAV